VKVWIYKGDVLEHNPQARDQRISEAQGGSAPKRS
jgi:small subunit ribosomal protein S3